MRISTGTDYSAWVRYFLVGFLVLGIDFLGWFGGIHALGDRMLNPMSSGVRRVVSMTGNPIDGVKFVYLGPRRIADLEIRLSEALVVSEEVDALKRENEGLRKLLGSDLSTDLTYIPVSVVGSGDELVISDGKVEGVEPGAVVVDTANVLLGRVVRISTFTSWVQNISANFVKVPVIVGGGRLAGTLENGVVEIEQGDSVYVGDRVITSGVMGEYMSEILVGRVVEVEDESANVHKKVKVEYLGNAGEIVFLVGGVDGN